MTSTKVGVDITHDGQVVRIVLDAPPGNVIDLEMTEGLRAAVARAGHEPHVKVVVLEGAGDHFSYGASIPEHRRGEIERVLPRFHDLGRELIDLGRPSLAVVRGRCLGGGLELAAACDWIFAAPNAEFGLPEIRLGVFPPLGSLLLPHRIGAPKAAMLCLTGRVVTAATASSWGLVDEVAADPGAAAIAWITEHLLPHSAIALHHATRAVRLPLRDRVFEDLEEVERLYLRELMRTEDAHEGLEAFLEKRPPVWKDR